MTLRDFYLICFAAASVIHAVQVVLTAKLIRRATGRDYYEARQGITIGVVAFGWQFGNFLAILGATVAPDGMPSGSGMVFHAGNFLRGFVLVLFPVLFASFYFHVPEHLRPQWLLRLGRLLWYPLVPWTLFALITIVRDALGMTVPLSVDLLMYVTLVVMLLYFAIFATVTALNKESAKQTGVAALVRARNASLVTSLIGVSTFALMLISVWGASVPFVSMIQLAAMLSSVPASISAAYRLYQFPFMDVFIREVLSGGILLGAFVLALSLNTSIIWIVVCAIVLAFLKAPLTRWVERVFLGYAESAEEQEERIGTAIRGLTQLDEFGARVSEILAKEVDAMWIDITSRPREDAVHVFELTGSGLSLVVGPRLGGRRYMSRQLGILRAARLQLAAHHHQLMQNELRGVTARAQMQALQAQINPHFLFNTLNVLASLIHSNPAKAEQVTQELADIFRYALESTRVEWVTLDDELRFLESYLEIEKTRFEERLTSLIEVDDAIRSMKIPPMILQPLVENAVKHGIAPKIEGGHVRILGRLREDQLELVVEDTGDSENSASRHRGAGVGLKNIRERLQHVYGEAGVLRLETRPSGGTRAVLILPLFAGVHL
jgi:hypothetical protein